MRHKIELTIFIAFVAMILALLFILVAVKEYVNPHQETITVTDKNINPVAEQQMWLVYTNDEVYCVKDLFFAGFFRASDVYNKLKVGETYDVIVSGTRIPFFSSYKVIRDAQQTGNGYD